MEIHQKTELEEYRKAETLVTFVLTDGEGLTGRINWFDDYNISVIAEIKEEERKVTISKHSIAYYYEHKESDEPVSRIRFLEVEHR